MRHLIPPFAAMALALALACPAWAQQAGPMPGMAMPTQTPGNQPGTMMAGMDKMMKDMAAVPMTGDTDREFVGMMIPHHQGAIDMARSELAHGKDPMLRRLARAIIAAQDKEIAEMRSWQRAHPAGP